MSDQALLTRPEGTDISAELQQRVRDFTGFYEQHAYVAYNLALRIACAPQPAARAVERGFLRQIESDGARGLVAGTVEAALQEATGGPPDPGAAGDETAQRLLTAIAGLAPAERAALAMTDLAEAGVEEVGAALGVPSEQAGRLLQRGREGFAAALGESEATAHEAARDWMWAAPPQEIWERLYPRFHQTVERQLRRGSVEQTLVLKPDSPRAPAKAGRRAKRQLRRRPPSTRRRWPRLRLALAGAAICLVVGGAAATQLLGGEEEPAPAEPGVAVPTGGERAPSGPATGEAGVKPHKPLTAELLDKLRLRELRQLRAYGKREADRSLPVRQRRAASRRITAIERAARARLRAQQKREQALRDRAARERARSQAPPPPAPAPRSETSRPPRTQRPQSETSQPAGPPTSREEADRSCLLDENSGQYICPR